MLWLCESQHKPIGPLNEWPAILKGSLHLPCLHNRWGKECGHLFKFIVLQPPVVVCECWHKCSWLVKRFNCFFLTLTVQTPKLTQQQQEMAISVSSHHHKQRFGNTQLSRFSQTALPGYDTGSMSVCPSAVWIIVIKPKPVVTRSPYLRQNDPLASSLIGPDWNYAQVYCVIITW